MLRHCSPILAAAPQRSPLLVPESSLNRIPREYHVEDSSSDDNHWDNWRLVGLRKEDGYILIPASGEEEPERRKREYLDRHREETRSSANSGFNPVFSDPHSDPRDVKNLQAPRRHVVEDITVEADGPESPDTDGRGAPSSSQGAHKGMFTASTLSEMLDRVRANGINLRKDSISAMQLSDRHMWPDKRAQNLVLPKHLEPLLPIVEKMFIWEQINSAIANDRVGDQDGDQESDSRPDAHAQQKMDWSRWNFYLCLDERPTEVGKTQRNEGFHVDDMNVRNDKVDRTAMGYIFVNKVPTIFYTGGMGNGKKNSADGDRANSVPEGPGLPNDYDDLTKHCSWYATAGCVGDSDGGHWADAWARRSESEMSGMSKFAFAEPLKINAFDGAFPHAPLPTPDAEAVSEADGILRDRFFVRLTATHPQRLYPSPYHMRNPGLILLGEQMERILKTHIAERKMKTKNLTQQALVLPESDEALVLPDYYDEIRPLQIGARVDASYGVSTGALKQDYADWGRPHRFRNMWTIATTGVFLDAARVEDFKNSFEMRRVEGIWKPNVSDRLTAIQEKLKRTD